MGRRRARYSFRVVPNEHAPFATFAELCAHDAYVWRPIATRLLSAIRPQSPLDLPELTISVTQVRQNGASGNGVHHV